MLLKGIDHTVTIALRATVTIVTTNCNTVISVWFIFTLVFRVTFDCLVMSKDYFISVTLFFYSPTEKMGHKTVFLGAGKFNLRQLSR